jgi:hypothetical protein
LLLLRSLPTMQQIHSQNGVPKPQSALPPNRPPHAPDVKPRLTKEQHDILEAEFQRQNKPTTATKKSFAESLNVPVDKINVSLLSCLQLSLFR